MGKEDTIRQALNVYRMRLLGAKGTCSHKRNRNFKRCCFRDICVSGQAGSMTPTMYWVRLWDPIRSRRSSVISRLLSARRSKSRSWKEGRLPDVVLACVGGGSNAIGAFYNFIDDKDVRLIGCEAAGRGVDTLETAATIAYRTSWNLPRHEILFLSG